MEKQSTWEDIVQLRHQLRDMHFEYWLNENLFVFNWWLLLTVTIGMIIIWVSLVDKKRIHEIVTFGLLVSLTGFILDTIGTSFAIWAYPVRITPVVPPIIEIHKVQMPIIYMMVYQYFTAWKSFFITITISALVFAFVFEPLLVWLGIYEMYLWEYIYSFPIYILIGVFFKWLTSKLIQIEQRQES